MNIQDAIDVIESVSGFTDESTPVGEAWLEVLSFINRPTALAQPEPVGPTDEEIEKTAKLIHASMRFAVPDNHYTCDWVERGNSLMQSEARRTARAVLARYGTPTIQPVPVSERLPGPEDYLDEGWAWFFNQRIGWRQAVLPVSPGYTHWLPANALPTPKAAND